jgi:hypothetical protein
VYDYKFTHIAHTNHVLASSGANIIDKSGNTKYTKHDRTYQVQLRHLCSNISAITATTSAENVDTTSSISMEKKCVDLLQDLRNEGDDEPITLLCHCAHIACSFSMTGKKHWDAQVIVIDMHPPNNSSSHSKPTKNSSQLTRDRQLIVESQFMKDTAKSQLTNKSLLASKSELTSKRQLASKSQPAKTFKSSSLGILLNLDLNYLRPKLIFVRMVIINHSAILMVEPVFSNSTKNCSIAEIG